ncbi:MAG: hypothetical protein PVI57_11535 [Gemmatimonadota bacterium]
MRFRRAAATGLVLRSAVACLLVACGSPNEHPPDQVLRDSLGLAETDQVFRVEVVAEDGREDARPPEVTIPPGAFVEFVTGDRRLHTVAFLLDDMDPSTADFLRTTDQVESPPLLELGSRFVLSFRGAPPGRYPYQLEGNGRPARGLVIVEEASR